MPVDKKNIKENSVLDVNKFADEVKKAFAFAHKDIQNLKNLVDKLNKRFDIVSEEMEILRDKIENMSSSDSENNEGDELGEDNKDVPPELPGMDRDNDSQGFYPG